MVLNSPFAQLVHTRSVLAVPAVATYWPASHSVHALQLVALLAPLNMPAAQLPHVRSVVAVPSAVTKLPATHAVLFTQGVAGLASSSQVPAAQATSVAVPPAHQPPVVHVWHTGGVELVPGVVCVVPAAQSVAGKHSASFGVVLTVPSAHAAHVRSTVAEGVFVECVPAAQSVQSAHVV